MSIERKAIERSLRKGLEQGLQQGLQQGLDVARRHLLRTLEVRFGAVPPSVAARAPTLTAEQLDRLLEAARTAESLAAFEAQLPAEE